MPHISRRTFVAGLGASLVPWQGARASQPKVIVVGAGLAGLAATFELKNAGADVTLIEQSNRVGGRVKTVRDHFADGAWVDVGGQTSGGYYANFFYFSSLFGLEFEEQQEFRQRPDYLLHLQGELLSGSALRADASRWPIELHESEKAGAPFRLMGQYLGPIAKKIGAVENVLKPEFAQYDQLTLRELLTKQGASDAAIELIDHTLNYNSVDTVSSLSVLRDVVRMMHMQGGTAINLKNGNQSLPDAFSEQLADEILLNHSLAAVERNGDGVQLQVETDGRRQTLYADYVVLAIPFTALRDVKFAPGLIAERQKIIDELPYTQIVQAWLQTRTRFWESDGPVSMVVSDGPLERLFNGSRQMSGDRGLLINWVNGVGTRKVPTGDPEEHVASVIREIGRIWPEGPKQIETTLTNDWGKSYVKGAYAHYAPGQMVAYASEIPKPIGRLHFAGEHTELVAPGMEGALTSGRRAASEIINNVN